MAHQRLNYHLAAGAIVGNLAGKTVRFTALPAHPGTKPPPGDYDLHPPVDDPIYGMVALMAPAGLAAGPASAGASYMKNMPISDKSAFPSHALSAAKGLPSTMLGSQKVGAPSDKYAASLHAAKAVAAPSDKAAFAAADKLAPSNKVVFASGDKWSQAQKVGFAASDKYGAATSKFAPASDKLGAASTKFAAASDKLGAASADKFAAASDKLGAASDKYGAASDKYGAAAQKVGDAAAEKWAQSGKLSAPGYQFVKTGGQPTSHFFVLSSRPITGHNSLVITVGFADLMDALRAAGGASVTVA